MFIIYKLIGDLVSPPGLICVVLLFCTFLAARRPRKTPLAVILFIISITFWFISTPFGAAQITGHLEDMYPSTLPPGNTPITVLVLSGGSSYDKNGNTVQPEAYSLERIYCALNIAKKRGGTIIFSGGNVYGYNQKSEAEIMSDCAINLGFKGKIILENKSRTTRENLKFTAKILQKEKISDLVLVTNAFHMPRSMYSALKFLPEVKIYPYSSGKITDPVFRGLPSLFPKAGSLLASCLGVKEIIGLTAYRFFDN